MTFDFLGLFSEPQAAVLDSARKQWPTADCIEILVPLHAIAVRVPESAYDVAEEDMPAQFSADALALSSLHPGATFVLLRTSCWGGGCADVGEVVQGGKHIASEEGEQALRRLNSPSGIRYR